MDLNILNRSPEYWDGLTQRLGWDPRQNVENSFLVHSAGVSFNDRQSLLKSISTLCQFDRSPAIKLEREPDNPYDRFAVKILVVTHFDDITGDAVYSHVGYIPKGRCPYCARTLSGKKAAAQVCPDCNADISVTSPVGKVKTFNRYVTENFSKITASVDTVTVSKAGGSRGLDIWLLQN